MIIGADYGSRRPSADHWRGPLYQLPVCARSIGGFQLSEVVRSPDPLSAHSALEALHGCEVGVSQLANLAAPDLSRLTRREREVLHVLGLGESNRLLARRLGIAERTVKAHVSSIVAKLELRSRGDATALSILHHAEVHHSLDLPNGQ